MLIRFITRLIKSLVPYKTASVKEFADVIKKEGGCEIVGKRIYTYTRWGVRTSRVGFIGRFYYMIEFIAETSSGAKVFCNLFLFDRNGTERGTMDVKDRLSASIQHEALVNEKMKELEFEIPGIVITDQQKLDDLIF